MVNEESSGTVSSSNLDFKNSDANDGSLSETMVSFPKKMDVKEIEVASDKDEEKNASKEVLDEESAVIEMENGKFQIEEEENEETATEEDKKNEDNTMEEDTNNELNAMVEYDDVQSETEEEDEEEEGEKQEGEEQEEEKNGEENEEKKFEQEEEKVGANSKEKDKRSRQRSKKKKMSQRGSDIAAAKAVDKPGPSGKRKVSKRAESMGLVFMCSSKTKKDCYRYNVLGLPASKRDIVQKVYKGMRLFLFDIDLRLMYGIYRAAGPGGYNIEPKAFKSSFPSQVRFTVLEDCLPLAEEKFKSVIVDNYYKKNKFDCQLNAEQVKKLCKLFIASSRGSKSKKLSRNVRAETRTRVDRGRLKWQNRDEERHSALVVDRRYYDRPIVYEREVFASRVAPLSRLPPPLPPPTATAPPSYASYGRTMEVDVYGRDRVVERRSHQLLDLDPRHPDEIGSRDPYILYREFPAYREPLYSADLPPEFNPPARPRVEYRTLAVPPPDYHYPAATSPEFGRHLPWYQY